MYGFELFAGFVVFHRRAEVYYFEDIILFFVDQDVFWLQVPVNNSEAVAVSDSFQNLLNYLRSILFAEGHLIYDFLEKLSSFAVLGDQEVFLGIFEDFVELEDVRVVKLFQRRHLRLETFLLLIIHRLLFYYFYCSLRLCHPAHAHAYFSKGTLTKYLAQLIEISKLALIDLNEV